MKRLTLLFLVALLFGQIFTLFFASDAEAAIETRNYGWTLGKYDTTKKIFTPSDTDEFPWAYTSTVNMRVRTIGPWSVNQNSSTNRVGSIISFVDKNRPEDNGYPMVGEPQWDQWITQFKGNGSFVKSALDTWSIDTPSGRFKFANFSQLVELCGGKGVSYSIEKASSYYLSSELPYATLLANKTAVKAGESVTFTIRGQSNTYYSPFIDLSFAGAGQTFWSNKRFTGPRVDTTYSYTFNTPGTYDFSITVRDSVWRSTISRVTIAVGQDVIPDPPTQPPSDDPPDEPIEDPNREPVARFSWPTECYESDTVDVTENSYDRDGEIVDWRWRFTDSTGVTHDLTQGGGQVTFQNPSTYELRLNVEDDDGATDSVTKTILVKPPIPAAKINYSGFLKENRKVVLDSSGSSSPSKFPIDHSKDQWTITAVSGGSNSDIKYGRKNDSSQEVLFKKAGTYKVGLKVANSRYGSEWVYKEMVILPDDRPVANFMVPTIIFREPLDQGYAIIKLTDKSFSIDDDFISQRNWKYKFDSNNNGDFTDDLWVVLDSNNNVGPYLRVNHVGKYLFELEVKENFGQETIPELITDADYRRGDTLTKASVEKVVDIKNIAPVTSFSASIKPKVDIIYSQGYLVNHTTRFPNMINNLDGIVGTKLRAKGIDVAFYNTANLASETIYRWSSFADGDHIAYDGITHDPAEMGQFASYRTFDLRRLINKSDIISMPLKHNTYERGGSIPQYKLYVSQDNINWSLVRQWGYAKNSSSYRRVETINIYPSEVPVNNFRYIKLNAQNVYGLDGYEQWVTVNNILHANLADIQSKAGQNYRPDAMKFVVSLAEEPYVDGTSTNYTNTANILNQKNIDLVAFANTTSQASVQQLTSKVTNKKLILTSTDLNPALDQLADYVISRANSLQLVNEIPILLNQSLTFTPTYSDYEDDPKFRESWSYTHDPGFVDNNGISTYNSKTLATPVTTFDKYGKYNVYYKAQDDPTLGDIRFSNYRLWSDPAPTSIIVHRKPIASFTVQPGTLYITDTSYDPDFQYKRPDKGVVERFWQWKKTSDTNWTVGKPTGVAQPGDYYFYLRVKDNYGVWSDPYQMAITVTNLNRPPNADFNWSPALLFEADDVNLKNLSTDPDGDPLTYQWTIFDPLRTTKQYSTKDTFISNSVPGTYWVTLRVWDNRGGTDVVTKSFLVSKLNVLGYVRHTEEWDTKRINYNRAVSGMDNFPRGYNVFWAGEKFILTADTTDTASSLTKAVEVKVSMPALGIDTELQGNAEKTRWTGEMWDERLVNVADGPYKFIFTALYSNGAQKACEVWVNIDGSIYDYHLFHRAE